MLETRIWKLFTLIVHIILSLSITSYASSTNNLLDKLYNNKSNTKTDFGNVVVVSANKSSGNSENDQNSNTRFYPSLPLNNLNIPTYSSSFTPSMNSFYPAPQQLQIQHQPQTYHHQPQLQQYQFPSYPNPYAGHPFPQPQQYSHSPYLENYGYGNGQNERGITFPLPLGNFPPYFGVPNPGQSTPSPQQPPYPSTSPYPVQKPLTTPGQYYPQPQAQPPQPQYQNPLPNPSYYDSYAQNNQINTEGFDVGSLPQQVRVPGIIQVKISEDGKSAEIYCEFPKYIILIQGIFWHHKSGDPFGSYFDTQNGFEAFGIQVQSIDKWSSKLLIKEVSPHYYGTFKCISAAVLPADDVNRFRQPYSSGFGDNFGTRSNSLVPPINEFQARESKSSSSEEILKATEDSNKRSRKMRLPDTIRRQSRDFQEASTKAYDPFEVQESIRRLEFLDNGYVSEPPNYLPSSYDHEPIGDIHRSQNGRHIIYGQDQQSPGSGYPTQGPPPPLPSSNPNEPFGLKLPFYKPSYTVFTIYQEISINPSNFNLVSRNRNQNPYDYDYNKNYRSSSLSRSRSNRFHRFL